MKTHASLIFLIAYTFNSFNFYCFFSMCGWMFVGLGVELDIVLRCKIALIKFSPSCVCITLSSLGFQYLN